MKEMEQKLKMKLLSKLMEEMDDSIMSSFSKSEDEEPMVEVKEVEHKEMPMDEAKDFIKEKMNVDESYDDEEDDDNFGNSRLMEKLRDLRKKKSKE